MNPQRDRMKQGVTGEGQVVAGFVKIVTVVTPSCLNPDFVRMEKTERIMGHVGVQNFEPTT